MQFRPKQNQRLASGLKAIFSDHLPFPVSEIPEQWVKKYRVFYEVLPYRVLMKEGHGSPKAPTRAGIIQADFDVDVQGLSNKPELELPRPADALG